MAGHFLLIAMGSAGDVHPFVGVGRALSARGHRVTLLAAEPFRGLVEAAGLEFDSFWSTEDFDRTAAAPGVWDPLRGPGIFFGHAMKVMPRLYQRIEAHWVRGRTVLVAHTVAFAARVFEERHGGPAATLHLAPAAFRSDHAQPVLPGGADMTRLPRFLKRALWAVADRFLIDPYLAPAVNALRADAGLPPVRRIFREWLHSPQRVIGLFPAWFAPPQPDWPPQLRLTGFPRFDERELREPDFRLEDFLAAGSAPVVFTPGSANRQASAFFAAAVEAAGRLDCRAVLLTPMREQVPRELPPSVHWAGYAPFSGLLPRAAAFVHHGGIGSVAQGLAAGVPQLLSPMSHDQPDNAARVRRLGAGTCLPTRAFTGRKVAAALAGLIGNPAIRRAAEDRAAALAVGNPVADTCHLLEALIPAAVPAR